MLTNMVTSTLAIAINLNQYNFQMGIKIVKNMAVWLTMALTMHLIWLTLTLAIFVMLLSHTHTHTHTHTHACQN